MQIKELYPDVIAEDIEYEYKARLNSDKPIKWAKTIVGYANGNGGTMFVGVSDSGEAFGIDLDEIDKTKLLIAKIKKNNENDINKPLKLMQVLAVAAIPLLLILKQPDYGTGSAFVFALLCMLFTAGISKKYIITGILLVIIIIPLLYFFVLPPHAKQRIQVFLNPAVDPRGSGYNLTQSKIAIGAGQLTGMGYLKGNQTQLGFLYPKSTDFIFSVIGEELGFVVAGSIIILYVVLITKSISIAKTARDELGSLIASGITGIFFFHMLENIGMTIGMLPITGVPLPFVSYGGSSLLSNFIMIALLLNISGRRQKNIFIE